MRKQHLWYLDSGCSKYMTGDASKFVNITLKQEGRVTYGDNKGKILGKGTIGNENNFLIHDVLYVEGLKHNLLSINQLCDRGYQVTFRTNSCEIRLPNSKEVLLVVIIIGLVVAHIRTSSIVCSMPRKDKVIKKGLPLDIPLISMYSSLVGMWLV